MSRNRRRVAHKDRGENAPHFRPATSPDMSHEISHDSSRSSGSSHSSDDDRHARDILYKNIQDDLKRVCEYMTTETIGLPIDLIDRNLETVQKRKEVVELFDILFQLYLEMSNTVVDLESEISTSVIPDKDSTNAILSLADNIRHEAMSGTPASLLFYQSIIEDFCAQIRKRIQRRVKILHGTRARKMSGNSSDDVCGFVETMLTAVMWSVHQAHDRLSRLCHISQPGVEIVRHMALHYTETWKKSLQTRIDVYLSLPSIHRRPIYWGAPPMSRPLFDTSLPRHDVSDANDKNGMVCSTSLFIRMIVQMLDDILSIAPKRMEWLREPANPIYGTVCDSISDFVVAMGPITAITMGRIHGCATAPGENSIEEETEILEGLKVLSIYEKNAPGHVRALVHPPQWLRDAQTRFLTIAKELTESTYSVADGGIGEMYRICSAYANDLLRAAISLVERVEDLILAPEGQSEHQIWSGSQCLLRTLQHLSIFSTWFAQQAEEHGKHLYYYLHQGTPSHHAENVEFLIVHLQSSQ